jgi:dTDP-4-amino-4,6-dideoxygalactose transaminase
MDPALIEAAITDQTRAILCVHQVGMPCDLAGIFKIARRHNLPVIEDAACAIGSEILWDGQWEKIGKPHSDVACFSFHPRKLLTTGDGGIITTNQPDWDRQFRLWRQHGMSVPDTLRHSATEVIFESYLELGYNYRLTDLQAAMGREQLKRLPKMVEIRRSLAQRYEEALSQLAGLTPPAEPAWAHSNWQSYCVRLPAGCDQRQVMQFMLEQGVATRRGVMCAHLEPAYAATGSWSCGLGPGGCGCPPHACRRLQESEHAQNQTIIIPLYPQLSEADQDWVIESLAEACQTSR